MTVTKEEDGSRHMIVAKMVPNLVQLEEVPE
jgi:hypothetical protein